MRGAYGLKNKLFAIGIKGNKVKSLKEKENPLHGDYYGLGKMFEALDITPLTINNSHMSIEEELQLNS